MYQNWIIDNFWLLIRYSQQIHIQVCRFIIFNNNFQTHIFVVYLFIYQYFAVSYIQIFLVFQDGVTAYTLWTCSSTQIVLQLLYIFCYIIMQTRNARLHNCITISQNSFSRWNLKMASVRPKHVFSNFFISCFLIITSIRKLLVVLLTVSPYQH